MTTQQVRNSLLFILAIVSFGLVVWAELTGHAIDPTLNTLLGVVLGFLGSQSATQQGVETTQNASALSDRSLAVRVIHESAPGTSAGTTGTE